MEDEIRISPYKRKRNRCDICGIESPFSMCSRCEKLQADAQYEQQIEIQTQEVPLELEEEICLEEEGDY